MPYPCPVSVAEVAADLPDLVRPLRRAEYERLVAAGAFDDERIELLEGVLVRMTPQDPAHADAVGWLGEELTRQVRGAFRVRVASPLAQGDASVPEPDLAVVPAGRYRHARPERAVLAIEVARTSLRLDLGRKARLYARHGVEEYWVVDLTDRAVHVHRDARAGVWTHVEVVRSGVLASRAVPGVAVDLAELFGDGGDLAGT